jgi:hypothetical protein
MTLLERRMLAIALVLGLLTITVASGKGLQLSGWRTPVAAAHVGSFYGANETWVALAASEWPQKDPNWCGVANIEVVANYTYQIAGGANNTPFTTGGQQRIWNDLNSDAAISLWGYAPKGTKGSGIKANIASDGGTDPRSIAWGIFDESTTGYFQGHVPSGHFPRTAVKPAFTFHNVIYHNSVNYAVEGMARTLEHYGQPLSVTMAHGLHSDVVSGVYAQFDPLTHYPNSNVNAVNAWDPAVGTLSGGYQSAREVTWDNYSFNNDTNMWGSTYNANNGYDPDPSVGIYVPNSQYPTHWIGYRTDIEPDTFISVSPDFAVDENFNVMQHP